MHHQHHQNHNQHNAASALASSQQHQQQQQHKLCIDYNSPLGCPRRQCHYKHVYEGNIIARTIEIDDDSTEAAASSLSLVENYNLRLIGSYSRRHIPKQSKQTRTFDDYAQSMSIPGTPTHLHLPALGSKLIEHDAWQHEQESETLPIIMTIKACGHLSEYNFVIYRNTLNVLMNNDKLWRLHLQKIGTTICIKPCKASDERHYDGGMTNRGVAGYEFERLCSVVDDDHEQVDEEYCIVQACRIGEFNVAFAAEVDGYTDESLNHVPLYGCGKQENGSSTSESITTATASTFPGKILIELKTNASGHAWNQQRLHTVYVQSFVAGIPHIIVASLQELIRRKSTVRPTSNLRELAVTQLQRIDVDAAVSKEFRAKKLQRVLTVFKFITANIQADGVYRLHRIRGTQGRNELELAKLPSARTFVSHRDLQRCQKWKDERKATKRKAEDNVANE